MAETPVQAVSFDLGGTLLEVHPSVGETYAAHLDRAGIRNADTEAINAAFSTSFKARTAARTDLATSEALEERFWRGIVEDCVGGYFPDAVVPEPFFRALWEAFARADCWRPLPGAPQVLETLRANGLRLAILSNYDSRLPRLIRDLGWGEHFEAVLASSRIGWSKPATEAFTALAKALALAPAAVCHLGDSLESDYRGARNAGMPAVLLDPHGQAPDGIERIEHLRELPRRLRAQADGD